MSDADPRHEASAAPEVAPPAPESPGDADAVRPVIVGTALWVIAGIVLLTQFTRLKDDGHQWWLAVCAVGAVLGLAGTWVVLRRRRAYRDAGRDAG